MIHSTKYKGLLFLLFVLFLSTCKKKEIYPSIPYLEFKEALFFPANDGTDSIMKLVFTFKDGDGDIGLDQTDTFPPFQADWNKYKKATNPFYYNLHVNYFELVDNQFQHVVKILDPDATPPVYDTLRNLYRIENITPEGRHKAIRGDIEVSIFPSPYPDAKDTVRYKFFIYDRALNKSNEVETPNIIWKRQ
jgi:hypothetical protein